MVHMKNVIRLRRMWRIKYMKKIYFISLTYIVLYSW